MPWKILTTRLIAYAVAIVTGAVLTGLTAIGLDISAEAVEGLETFLAAVFGGGMALLAVYVAGWWEGRK